jgi:hypothetical protein
VIEDLKKYYIGCMGFMLLLLVGPYVYMAMWSPKPSEPVPSKTDEVNRLIYSNPDEALQRCRKILSESKDEAERQRTQGVLKQCLQSVFNLRIKEGKLEDARAILAEMNRDFPRSAEEQTASRTWREQYLKQAEKAVDEGEIILPSKFFAETLKNSQSLDQWDRAKIYGLFVEWKIAQCRKAAKDGDSAAALDRLLEAAAVVDRPTESSRRQRSGHSSEDPWKNEQEEYRRRQEQFGVPVQTHDPVVLAAVDCWPSEKLISMGSELMTQEKPWGAVVFFEGAFYLTDSDKSYPKLGLSEPSVHEGRKQVGAKLLEARLATAHQIQGGKLPYAGLHNAEQIFQRASCDNYATPAQKVQAYEGGLQVEIAQFQEKWKECVEADQKRLTEARVATQAPKKKTPPNPYRESPGFSPEDTQYYTSEAMCQRFRQAEETAIRILRSTAGSLWMEKMRQADFDPWPQVPKEILEQVQKKIPNADEQGKRTELERLIRNGTWIPPAPGIEEVRNVLPELYARWGVCQLTTNRNEALTRMRHLLRKDLKSDAAKRIIVALREAIRTANSRKDFQALFELTGYYVAEVGTPESGDTFRGELKDCLQNAAQDFAKTSEMKHIFMLGLLADAYPDDPEGKKAREQAMKRGVEIVAKRHPSLEASKNELLPFGFNGTSTVAINNGTSYHIMIFFEGSESFYVRLNPYRRGSVVLKDGDYNTSVICTSDSVTPYRDRTTFKTNYMLRNYIIDTPGSKSETPDFLLESLMGGYVLLRTPPGQTDFRLESNTGIVFPVK